jgi:glycine/sarcosine N-methyltransferase
MSQKLYSTKISENTMENRQNKFYSSISKYYSEIFPFNPAQLQFVNRSAKTLSGKNILDIGCATGELAYSLAEAGAKVTGIDLNEDLLAQAKKLKAHPGIHFQKGDMLRLKADFQTDSFDIVVCFGNTLAHLLSLELIRQMTDGVYSALKPGGVFLLQILNYNYIFSEPVTRLPAIETENIKFTRNYHFKKDSPILRFQTDLFLKKEGITISNDTNLLGLQSNELNEILNATGFHGIEFFSNFAEGEYGGKHLPLVARAQK